MPPVRRLTAILAADVAGYSRLMGADEDDDCPGTGVRPTVAHAAALCTINQGVLAADEAMAEIQKPIWASEDLKIGLASFRENGPGLAKFTGR